MNIKMCPVCNNHADFRLRKQTTDYHQCSSCRLLFSNPIDQEGMVGGEHEGGRNEEFNHLRIGRINTMVYPATKENIHILDFGCGHGYFIDDLNKDGYMHVVGYDAYNLDYNRMPEPNKFHIAVMTEVIEHISHPFVELDLIHRSLLTDGILMIETSFVDIAEQDNIPLENFFYIAPQNGHSTIHSHHSLDMLMLLKGFIPVNHIDRHVRLYRKVKRS